ncbi:MAG: prolyl oligopeptidase family serine peptidase [Planctomycetaceae bacterium]|nr:prolyl oligopeptidase family serine peptidase [Planctomycetaceae bacterium]
MSLMKIQPALLLLIVFFSIPVLAEDDPGLLTLDRIYGGDEFSAQSVSVRWLDEASYTAIEDTENGQEIALYDAESGERSILVAAEELVPPGGGSALVVEDYAFSNDRSLLLIYTNSQRVWRRNTRGDYWLLDRSARQLWPLGGGGPAASMMFAKLSPDGTKVAFVRNKKIFVEDVLDHSIVCLTPAISSTLINGTSDWVYEEELGLRDGYRWSPDSKSIAYWQLDTDGVELLPLINNTDSLYPTVNWIPYPKVGQRNSSGRVGVVTLDNAETTWMSVPGDPRNHYIAWMEWQNGQLVLQQLNRLQNTNRVMRANPLTGDVRTIAVDQDEAWVEVNDDLEWLDDGRFTLLSERTGWRQLHLHTETGETRLVTPGEFDVIKMVGINQEDELAYFIASPQDATQRFLYSARLDGSEITRITPEDRRGNHQYRISPNSKWAFHTVSTFDEPPVTHLVTLPEHRRVRMLEDNKELSGAVNRLRRTAGEFLRVDGGEGVVFDAWCIKPPDFDPVKKYPLLLYVYGEPAGTTVVDRWNGKSYLWHLMLAQRGYVVISIDNRGTRVPRGRAWRKSIYKRVGVLPPQDQATALQQLLRDHPYLDSQRVGVWGWSGGGSMSLNAIFKYPELYRTAIAIAAVPNQRYYDTIYQERYMGLPADNVDGFREGSPINFAHQLEGNLLVIHGTGDDNCHYQTFEMLVNELVRHGKQFSMMSYPNRTHAIREGENTTQHLRTLMTRYLLEHLPAGAE